MQVRATSTVGIQKLRLEGDGDASHALGACSKCDDDNPLRSYRLVARFDTVVYSLYTWGRDAGANFNVVMDLALKLPKHLAVSSSRFQVPG